MFLGGVEDRRQSCASSKAAGLVQSKVEDVESRMRRLQSVVEAGEIGIGRATGKYARTTNVHMIGGTCGSFMLFFHGLSDSLLRPNRHGQ